MTGSTIEDNLALIQTMVGENNRAISTLTRLLKGALSKRHLWPNGITPALLRLDPLWDPLRGDPDFRKLCEEKIDKSIAVLPFENLSDDTRECLLRRRHTGGDPDQLSKIADLKVISRTSSQSYRANRAISVKSQGAWRGNTLEGSVQTTANRVRVNVQLINAETDYHLWADTYDRN